MPCQLCGVGFSLGSASKARSIERMSHTLRASILTGAGILPSATISSNFAAETPMYIAASSRDRPRRGSGRISERARAMATTVKSAYQRSVERVTRQATALRDVAVQAEVLFRVAPPRRVGDANADLVRSTAALARKIQLLFRVLPHFHSPFRSVFAL